MTLSVRVASVSASAGCTSNVNATRRTSPGCMFEMSKRPAWSMRPSPELLTMFVSVSNERPLPTFFTVRYIVACSPFWMRPSPLPPRSSEISYAYWMRGRSRARIGVRTSTGGGSPPDVASTRTLMPSARSSASIGTLHTRFAFGFLGFVEPTLRPS